MELDWGTEDSEYLQKVELHSEGALNEVRPDIIVYNAGTDILDGDPLGGLSISPQVSWLGIYNNFIGLLLYRKLTVNVMFMMYSFSTVVCQVFLNLDCLCSIPVFPACY